MSLETRGVSQPAWRFDRLRRIGIGSWAILGIILLAVVVMSALGALSGIVIPLIIAFIVGTVLDPLVVRLRGAGLPASLAAVVGLITALAVLALICAIVAVGFLKQLPEITQRVGQGWDHLLDFARSVDLDPAQIDAVRAAAYDYVPFVTQGVLGVIMHTIFGLVSMALGLFFALFFLFFALRDSEHLPGWIARVSGQEPNLVKEVYRLTQQSMRGYVKGTAVTAIVTAPIFMIPLLLLKVPLAFPIFILYFFLSFIPFLGAWITGAFAMLIALSSGGLGTAAIVLLCLLVSNGTIQSTVNSWALGSSLRMHPVAVLIATMVGGSVAGVLGMVLGPPMLSACVRAAGAIRAAGAVHVADVTAPQP